MGWARLDDGWHDHRKTAAAGLEAAGLWAMCLTWAHKDRRTNPDSKGIVPDSVITRFAGAKTKRLTAVLHTVGYFDEHTSSGWPIHDFDQYLPKYDAEQNRQNGSKGGRPKRTGAQSETKPVSKPVSGLVQELEPVPKRSESDSSHVGASARRNPVPVPKPEEQKLPPSAGANGAALVAIGSADLVPANGVDVGAVVGEWIDSCSKRPPGSVISRVGKAVKALAEEGIDQVDIRSGLAAWQAKGADPSTLPSFVNQAMNASPLKTRQQQANDDMWQRAAERAMAAEGA